MLNISIKSFSYRKGIPEDKSGNGGGFVFDCRGIPNPGRLEAFKTLSGNDKSVSTYLEELPVTLEFIEAINKVIFISIDNYLERDFSHLSIFFGCTGGRHRSVFFANTISKYIRKNYPQTFVSLQHTAID